MCDWVQGKVADLMRKLQVAEEAKSTKGVSCNSDVHPSQVNTVPRLPLSIPDQAKQVRRGQRFEACTG